MSYYLSVLKKYTDFNGRASRAEFWYFTLFSILVTIILSIIDMFVFGSVISTEADQNIGVLTGIYGLATLLPTLAVGVRRLHDTDHSGWWLLIDFIPFIGVIWLIILFATNGTFGANRFGQPVTASQQAQILPPTV